MTLSSYRVSTEKAQSAVFTCKRWKVKRQLLPTLLFYNRRCRRERPMFFGLAKTATQSLASGVDFLPRHCTLPITSEGAGGER